MQLENLKNKKIWNFYMKKYRKIIAIQGDPIQKTNIKTDTTLLLALEAQRRGYKIYYYQTKDLTFSKNIVKALTNRG